VSWIAAIHCPRTLSRRWRAYAGRLAGTMAIAERGAAESAQRIADALEGAAIPYAIGGALALAVAGVPRGTADVDVNVFIGRDRFAELVATLRAVGLDIDEVAAPVHARRDGMFVARYDGMRIDVFLPSIPFSDEAARTRVRLRP
jgi:hypothetical protein